MQAVGGRPRAGDEKTNTREGERKARKFAANAKDEE